MSRRIHWATTDLVEDIAFGGGYDVQVGHDPHGDYEFVVTREGVEFRAWIAAVTA